MVSVLIENNFHLLTNALNEFCIYDIYSDENKVNTIHEILSTLTPLLKSLFNCHDLKASEWPPVVKLVHLLSETLSNDCFTEGQLDLIIELLRVLRNAATSTNNQCFVLSNEVILKFVVNIWKIFSLKTSTKEITILKISIQLMSNATNCKAAPKDFMPQLFQCTEIFRCLIAHHNSAISDCAVMLFLNSVSNEGCLPFFYSDNGANQVDLMITSILTHIDYWEETIVIALLQMPLFFESCFSNLPLCTRALMMQYAVKVLKSHPHLITLSSTRCIIDNLSKYLNSLHCRYLAALDHSTQNSIYEDVAHAAEVSDPHLVLNTLVLCCAMTSDEDIYLPCFQMSEQLVTNAVAALQSIHKYLKEKHIFPIAKLRSLEISNLLLLKKNLVRLIGNLSYRSLQNQDIIREEHGIELILECTAAEDPHTYITQWSILAIRNLLENNVKNQAVVASMSNKGQVVNPDCLKDLKVEQRAE